MNVKDLEDTVGEVHQQLLAGGAGEALGVPQHVRA